MRIQSKNQLTWLNYHHLFYFMVIATEGSISRASKKLLVGQPSLSAQLKTFEESLGVDLFHRSHRKLTLTENGIRVLDYAKEIFKLGNEMVQHIGDFELPDRIHLQVGALDSVPKSLISKLVRTALKERNCSVSVLETGFDELMRELAQHRVDLVISNHTPVSSESNSFYIKKISREKVFVYGSKEFLKYRKGFPDSLDGAPMILPTHHSRLRYDIDHYLKLKGIRVDLVCESQDTALQKLLATDGLGLIALTEVAAERQVDSKDLHLIGELSGVYEELFLIAAERKIENPIASQLMRHFDVG